MKVEKIKFESLEKLNGGQRVPERTDDEIVAILSDKGRRDSALKTEGVTFISHLFSRFAKSKDLRERVNKIFFGSDSP